MSCFLFQTPINDSNANNVTEYLVMETAESTELDSYDVFLATSTITHIVEHTSSLGEVSFVTNTAKKVQVLQQVCSNL